MIRRREYRVVWYRQRPKYNYDGKRVGEYPPDRHCRGFVQKRSADRLVMILSGRGGEYYTALNGGRDGKSDGDYPGQEPWWCREGEGHCTTFADHHDKLHANLPPLVGEPVIEERWAEYGPWESAVELPSESPRAPCPVHDFPSGFCIGYCPDQAKAQTAQNRNLKSKEGA